MMTVMTNAQNHNAPVTVDPGNAMWHIGFTDIFGTRKGKPLGLDCYVEFVNSASIRAIGSARNFNKSLHPIRQVALTIKDGVVAGQVECLVTPDIWVPADGQPFTVVVEVEGRLAEGKLTGTYRAKRPDGEPLHEGGSKPEAIGPLAGGAVATETGFTAATWRVQLTPVKPPGGLDRDTLEIWLGVKDGHVLWGRLGVTAEPPWPAARLYPFPVNGLAVSDNALVTGSVTLDERHVHPGGDPAKPVQMELRLCRVQGLCSSEANFGAFQAYGRGSVTKGEPSVPQGLWIYERDERPWWTPVAGHRPLSPGEHPRLLFRKDDLPALRQRAQTVEGAAIVTRLRKLLDGQNGETLTTRFSETPPDNHAKAKPMPIGTFTSWHAAGYGMLYQLTGEAKYAGLARQSVQLMFDGKYDIDNRYSWVKPGTDIRAGQLLTAVAYAYDLCYDAWPDDFRRQVALAIQNYAQLVCTGERVTIAHLVGRSKYPPGSNHYGSLIGGAGTALIGILGDPGVDSALVAQRLAEAERNLPRMLELGFGDAGWFAEGFGASSALSRIPVLHMLLAERVALGRDYRQPRPNAEWLGLFWVMHLGGTGLGNIPNRGVYEGDDHAFRDGDFAAAFAAVAPERSPALKWAYETFLGSREPAGAPSWNADRRPLSAALALVTWPIGVAARNPAELMPKVAVDRVHGYFVARNRWKDADDIIVTHWLEYGPKGYYSSKDAKGLARAGNVRVWGFGLRTGVETGITGGPVTHFESSADGSFTMSRGRAALAVDLGGKSGAEVVVVALSDRPLPPPGQPAFNEKATTRITDLKMGAVPVRVFTLQTGPHPTVRIADERTIVVGARRFTWDEHVLK
jgi:hypothetical protein